MRISNEPGRKRERKRKNAIYSGHLRLCLQPKGSARTPLGPTFIATTVHSMINCAELNLFGHRVEEDHQSQLSRGGGAIITMGLENEECFSGIADTAVKEFRLCLRGDK